MGEAGDEKKRPPVVLHGKYELGRVLGHGSFAKVFHARNLENGDSVAMKVVSKEKVGMAEQIKREISVMRRVKHPNIVNLHEVMATKSKIYIAMEYVRGGELFAEVAAKGRLPDSAARSYFRQLISAVDFCHSRGVFHRDLKPENLLLDGATGGLKITDFGLSALSEHLRHDGLLHTACGTPAYVAPEVIGKRGYDGAKADLWSCGVVLFVLLAGYLPFHHDNIMIMYKKIHRGDFKFPPWISPETRRIVRKLLDPNPNTRITASQLMDTPWFKKQSNLEKQRNLDLETEQKQRNLDLETEQKQRNVDETETLNAFHIIALSEGLDLSGLFEESPGMRRFGTGTGERVVVAGLEEAARAGRLRVNKSGCATRVRMEGKEMGRKGRLGIAAEMFQFSPDFMVVEVNKDGGDTLEYNHFCNTALRPALKDIVWTANAAAGNSTVAGFESHS